MTDQRLSMINESIRTDMDIIANTSKIIQQNILNSDEIKYFKHVIEFNKKDIKELLDLKKKWNL